ISIPRVPPAVSWSFAPLARSARAAKIYLGSSKQMWLQPRASSPRKPRSRPVLIIDDDDDIRDVLREILPTWGYPVISAANGHEAMTFAREFTPATIILDLWMPKMNGFLFRRWQLGQPNLARVPVIVLTAAGPAGAD